MNLHKLKIRVVLLLVFMCPSEILAFTLPAINISNFITPAIANSVVSSVGLAMDHRSYEPATALGTAVGIAMGIEVTLVQPPTSLGAALGSLASPGGGSSTVAVPILPSTKFHMSKGFGSSVDIGISFLPPVSTLPLIGGSLFIGGDIKWVVYSQEEGPTWAVRASYNMNNLTYKISGQTLTVNTNTVSPQILISKKLTFADPYIGLGLQYSFGSLSIPNPLSALIGPASFSAKGSAIGAVFFCGVDIKVPNAGLRITIEGEYSPIGLNSLGTKIGFGF